MSVTLSTYLYAAVVLIVLIIAIAVVRRRNRGARSLDVTSLQDEMGARRSRTSTVTGPPSDAQAIELARSGRKIEAIKMIRELHRIGLADAKHWVEAAVANPAAVQPLGAPLPVSGSTASDEEAIALAMGGNKIAAIKMIRELHGLGLKDAKVWVEEAVRVRGGR